MDSINTASTFIIHTLVPQCDARSQNQSETEGELLMDGSATHNGFGDIDGPTTRFLARVAKETSYLHRDCAPAPTDERFFKEGVETYRVGQIKVGEKVITIHSFDGGRVFNTLQQQTEAPSDNEQLFVADWPIEEENGQSYSSFYFKSRPSKYDVKKAHQIHQIKIAMENRDLPQQFRCDHCAERVHWTKLTGDDCMTLEERVVLVKKQLCNCENTLALLREGLEPDQAISAVGSTTGKETLVPTTD